MARLEDLTPEARVTGVVAGRAVSVVRVHWHSTEALTLTYRDDGGRPGEKRLFRTDEPKLGIHTDSSRETVADILGRARNELLDLGLRNPLINYRELRARGVTFQACDHEQLFKWLVVDGRPITPVPAAPVQETLEHEAGDWPDGDDPAEHAGYARLETTHTAEQLARRLLASDYAARTYTDDKGVNILFVAIGMLRWLESDASSQQRSAPLVLVPVELKRSDAKHRFRISYSEEKLEDNVSLSRKLSEEFGIRLPPLFGSKTQAPEELELEAHFDTVEDAVSEMASWSVDREAACLGFFSFGKFRMFKDLDLSLWPDSCDPALHPVLAGLLSETEGLWGHDALPAEDADIDDLVDPQECHQVIEADSSQVRAILAVNGGAHLVVRGPPGTGKSQTITNIVAEAIGKGRTVLFVAEKMAALNVVKRNLDRVGLGDACLELHSNKTKRKTVLRELARTMESARQAQPADAIDVSLLREQRDQLNRYARDLHAPIGDTQVTPFQAFGGLARLHAEHDWGEETPSLESVSHLSRDEMKRAMPAIVALRAVVASRDLPSRNPFFGSRLSSVSLADKERVRRALAVTADTLASLRESAPGRQGEESSSATPDAITQEASAGWRVWRWASGGFRAKHAGLSPLLRQLASTLEDLESVLRMEWTKSAMSPSPRDSTLEALQEWVGACRSDFDRLDDLAAFNAAAARCMELSLGDVVELAETWEAAAQDLDATASSAWYAHLIERAFAERESLRQFSWETHQAAIQEFSNLDAGQLVNNRARLAHEHSLSLPRAGDRDPGLAIITREVNKKARWLSVRDLLLQASGAVQRLKPVFMMSPLSVADFLAPGSLTFDLVIFDEASQVRPVDAFGSLIRGSQVVVVGDEKQLPPTSFFEALVADGGGDDGPGLAGDVESILDMFSARGAPESKLRWHYRSRHESLIAVSNHEFYEDELVVFPSPIERSATLGLVLHHMPDTVYGRGGSRVNREEARAVARAVMAHASLSPQDSLGVAAFSLDQAQAILDQLEVLRRGRPECEHFFADHEFEPFFVKNLENVQGETRDVVLISIGYGRDADGFVSMNFGPLSKKGGWRRLNVLISRSRRCCEVFTNITSADIRAVELGAADEDAARGRSALKAFLQYAESGVLGTAEPTGAEPESEFEWAVLRALQARGYTVHCQVGVSGFRIDLAVVDEQHPGRYLLGIECDGAMYHSSRSARDRDRLRQKALEARGWTIHRVWSTEWFRNQARETERLVTAIETARLVVDIDMGEESGSDTAGAPGDQRDHGPAVRPAGAADMFELGDAAPEAPIEYEVTIPWGTCPSLADLKEGRATYAAAKAIELVVEEEGPIHINELARRLLVGAGGRKLVNSVVEATRLACSYAERQGWIVRDGDFAWPLAAPTIRPRERSHLPDYSRKLEFVSDAELDAAIVWVASRRPLDISGAARGALDAMGLGRANPGAEGRVAARTQQLVMTRQLKRAPSPEGGAQSRSRQTPRGHRRIHLLADEQMAMLGDSATSAVPVRHAGDASPAGARIPATGARPDTQVDGEAAVLVAQLADPAVRRSSQTRLRHMGRPAVGPLIKALADESLRRASETVLVELGQLAAPELSAAMLDGDERIRRAAEETLDRMGL